MEASLESFVQATDLDDLLVAHHQLTRINKEDAAALHEIIISGTDRQAIANMLMYPRSYPHRIATKPCFAHCTQTHLTTNS
jgi:hypothetical protein